MCAGDKAFISSHFIPTEAHFRKQRFREVKRLVQVHPISKWQSWDWTPAGTGTHPCLVCNGTGTKTARACGEVVEVAAGAGICYVYIE